MKYIDIHSHIAYDLDDGINKKEQMIDAIKKAKQQNYQAIVMTPHITCGEKQDAYLEKIKKRYQELKGIASEYQIDIYLGNEVLLNKQLYKMILNQSFYTMNDTKYVLVEADLRKSSDYVVNVFDECLNELLVKGYYVILAHVERYFKKGIDLEYVKYLIDKGCFIQVNTTSILKQGYESDYDNAIALLDAQLVHFVASDAHRSKESEIRVLNMKDCYEKLMKMKFDKTYIEDLMCNNGEKLIKGEKIHCKKYKKRSIINKLMFK